MESQQKINNSIYSELNERWYTAYDDPIALLRAESKLMGPWIQKEILNRLGKPQAQVLDIGCGAGFLSNQLVQLGHSVSGIDQSAESLAIAKKYDFTQKVTYLEGQAERLPFPDASFDVVTAMDFLEHVENPLVIIQEASRVLKPGGLFFFHTFNRNPLSWLVVIKFVEWFIKNTPENLHIHQMFIKPREMKVLCEASSLELVQLKGTRPNLFNWATLKGLILRQVPRNFTFSFTSSLMLSYVGCALKTSTLQGDPGHGTVPEQD